MNARYHIKHYKNLMGGVICKTKFTLILFFVFVAMLQTQKAEAQQKEIFGEIKNDELGFKTLYIYYDFFGEDNGHKFRVPTGATPAWKTSSEITSVVKVSFDASLLVDNVPISSFEYWFEGFTSLDKIEGLDNLQKTVVQTMKGMFKDCTSLKNVALSELDISQVTNFDEMFSGCGQLQYVKFNNTTSTNENGKYFSQMFKNCSTLNGIDLRHINLNNPANTSEMFSGCSMLNFIYLSKECDLSSTNTENMFDGCSALSGNFNVTDSYGNIGYFTIFPNEAYGILNETTLTLYYDNEKDTKRIGATEVFDLYYNDTPDWYTGTSSINYIIKKVIISENFQYYDPGKNGCVHLFSGFVDLEEITGFENINTSKVESMYSMFLNCKKIKKLNLEGLKTSNVTYMAQMFTGCYELEEITFGSSFDTKNVNDMSSMFRDCPKLKVLDLRQFDASKNENRDIINVYLMFDYTNLPDESETQLTTILVNSEKWDNSIMNIGGMYDEFGVFRGCENLVGENGTKYSNNGDDAHNIKYIKIDGGDNSPGYLSDGIYTISYIHKDQNGETINITLDNNYPTEYTYDDNGITINKPTQMPGYYFNTWSYTISTDKTAIIPVEGNSIIIPQNSVGNYEITITWNVESYPVSLPEHMEFVTKSTEDNKFMFNTTVTFKAEEGYKVTVEPTITTPLLEKNIISEDANIKYQYSFTMPYAPDGVKIEATVVEKPKYTVSFVTEYGTAPAQQTVIEDGKVQIPDVTLQQPAYEFKGWKTSDGELYNFDTPVTSSFTLTADWQKAPFKINPTLSEADKYISFPKDWKQFCKKQETYAELSYSITGGGEPDSCYITIESIEGTHQYHANNGKVEITTLPSFPGEYACTAVFTGDEESTTPSDTIKFTLDITAARGLILQLYKNVIFVNNISEKFETYQWYRYGEETDEKLKNGERQYFTEPTLKGSYWALLNGKIHACYMEDQPVIVKQAEVSISTYPNPAVEGEQFTIEINNFDPDTEYSMIISNSNGNIIKQLTVTKQQTTLSLPRGFYTGALMWSGNKQSFKIIVR